LVWLRPESRRLVDDIRSDTQAPLAELFRTAVWGELECGYETFWRNTVSPRARSYSKVFAAQLSNIADELPGLCEPAWMLSPPLRTHGRVLHLTEARPTIIVGTVDEELGVARMHPVIQGCHEYFVWRIQHTAASEQSTAPNRDGYAGFIAVENAALTAAARFFGQSQWEQPHLTWLGGLFPNARPIEMARRFVRGEFLAPEMTTAVEQLDL